MDEPGEYEAKIYMELCACLMTKLGVTELDIDLSQVPNRPFAIWRKVNGDKLQIKLVWDETAGRH